ncbi:hypothetical protein [Campylobacter sp. 19-13652]|uniref:hypothetical protein n=1 Tax=Campylobacter sp. 19-13652 TaxID=2840180 RepID=UPI001C791F12|nr:hypothetical protein [Campylobacter sp. 19-13652]BCX80167.1 hypothetical protein LBC_16290 [Campylobacter sp. 19-13652]
MEVKGNKALIKDTLLNLNSLQDSGVVERMLKSFSKDYTQKSDDKRLCYEEFAKHLLVLKNITTKLEVNIEAMACDGDVVFTHHTVRVHKLNA